MPQKRINRDELPPGIGVEEVRQSLEEKGYRVEKIDKPESASHLNSFEIQVHVKEFMGKKKRFTFGITDAGGRNSQTRAPDYIHGYVKTNPDDLEDAVEIINQALLPHTWRGSSRSFSALQAPPIAGATLPPSQELPVRLPSQFLKLSDAMSTQVDRMFLEITDSVAKAQAAVAEFRAQQAATPVGADLAMVPGAPVPDSTGGGDAATLASQRGTS